MELLVGKRKKDLGEEGEYEAVAVGWHGGQIARYSVRASLAVAGFLGWRPIRREGVGCNFSRRGSPL